jgi:replicative DNA helicase
MGNLLDRCKSAEEFFEYYLENISPLAKLENAELYVAVFEKRGWDTQPLHACLKLAKKDSELATKKAAERAKNEIAQDGLKAINEALEKIKDEKDYDKICEELQEVGKIKDSIERTAVEDKGQIHTSEQHKKYIKRLTDENAFKISLFADLAFPKQSLSYVGARTSRGKTIALVNIAREAVEQGRKVVFITLEMSVGQILNKMALSCAYELNTEVLNKIFFEKPDLPDPNPTGDMCKALRGEPHDRGKDFEKIATENMDRLYKYMDDKKLVLADKRGASGEDISSFISVHAQEGSCVLIDYVQKIRTINPKQEGYAKVQANSDRLQEAAAKTNAIIIAAAQFTRTGTATAAIPHDDEFSEESFRECGDLEQDAHNAVGIGWHADKQGRFFEVLKTREDNKTGRKWEFEFMGAFAHMKIGNEIDGMGSKFGNKPTPPQASGKWKKGKPAPFSNPRAI